MTKVFFQQCITIIYQFVYKNNFLMLEKERKSINLYLSTKNTNLLKKKKTVYVYCMSHAELQLTTGNGASCTTNIHAKLHC